MKYRGIFIAIFLALIAGVVWNGFYEAAAKKVFVWRDKEGKIHFSSQRPHPDLVGEGIEEKSFKDATLPERAESQASL